ncbi:MAG: hypothetical protein LC104_08730 [Bacteroidales bacterium]|nr:hypothetical protein [Bacteroidales bacterium]
MSPSIFLDFTLPNSTTWFYFSLFLTISLFFNFKRLFSLRNLDLLALFLFVPGLLLVQESKQIRPPISTDTLGVPPSAEVERITARADSLRTLGYLWLLIASSYWMGRCLLDMALARRPLPTANMTNPALIFFALSLLLCLAAVAFRRPLETETRVPPRATNTQHAENTPLSQTAKTASPSMAARIFTVIGQIVVIVGLVLVGIRHFSDASTGVMAATLFLMLPYTAYAVGRPDHIWPGATLVWAIFLYRSPILAGLLLGVAGAIAIFPLVLVPGWLQLYRGRGAGRFLVAVLLACAIGLGVLALLDVVEWGGLGWSLQLTTVENWQPWQIPSGDSIWTGTHWAYRLPIVMVYAAFALTAFLWPPVRDLGDLIALTTALIIGTQFWIVEHGGEYVLWYTPLVVLMVLRPNLLEMQPPIPKPLPRWLTLGLLSRPQTDGTREPLAA